MVRWIGRIAVGLTALAVVTVICGFGYEQWSRWSLAHEYPPSGRLVEVDGRSMHLNCTGSGTPTVILEAGLGQDASMSWHAIRPEIAAISRVCAYDRAGYLWSDRADGPATASAIAGRLHALLEKSPERGPYVFVGHSLGGLLTLVYADKYPDDVHGVVLVDSSHPEQVDRLPREVIELISMKPKERFLMSVTAEIGVMRFANRPPEDAPDARKLLHAFSPGSVRYLLDELDAFATICDEAGRARGFGDMPLIVLTATELPEWVESRLTAEVLSEQKATWSDLQRDLVMLSTVGEHRVVSDATHYIHHDNPGAVVDAIRDVVETIRLGE